ncbi:hypothetical protein ND748_23305 [Frankia sp. AiPs1]|uniref:hypothetical protein n=1 Tax=Frankia sp. AiPs1 TaxID=573493 RepID=UPI0020433A1B|nr:hypothetical protein [Frankia sp. AiPs1]MCM3924579.1 hypothetical protein [Frankia sp. AiPs1]
MFVVEVDEVGDAPVVAAYLQRVLAAAGEPGVGIEVFGGALEHELAIYHYWARDRGRLVYVRDARPSLLLAPIYDEVDETGPGFSPDHPLLDDVERARVLDYLRDCDALVNAGDEFDEDVLRPGAGEMIPMVFYTDGHWVWAEPTRYYLAEHHLAPHPEFLAHIRRRGYVCPPVDEVDRQRAREVLVSPVRVDNLPAAERPQERGPTDE